MALRQTRSSPARPLNAIQRLGLWPIRALWIGLPIVMGPGIMDAVADQSSAVRLVVELGLWAGWFVGLLAALAPSTVALTTLRIVAPAGLASAFLAALTGATWEPSTILSIGAGLVIAVLVMLPLVGDPMINGSAYGSERRMALRPPAALLLGPIQLAWLLVYVGIVTGPLLIASGQVLIGVPALAAGVALASRGVRTLHQLARRWIVFVPAGFVIHDYYSLAESLLIQRRLKPSLGLADRAAQSTETGRIDLSGGALGLTLSVRVEEALPVALRSGRSIHASSGQEFLFNPSLPGQVLGEARARAIHIE